MRGKKFKLGDKTLGFIFGITAFRLFCERTEKDIEHLDKVIIGDPSMDSIVRNHQFAIFICCANEVYNDLNGIDEDPIGIKEMEYLIDNTDQKDFDKLFQYYLDSSYVGKTMREHYGLSEVPDKGSKAETAKKKPTK